MNYDFLSVEQPIDPPDYDSQPLAMDADDAYDLWRDCQPQSDKSLDFILDLISAP